MLPELPEMDRLSRVFSADSMIAQSEPPIFVSTIIRKMRTDNEIGLALQGFRNSAKRAGRAGTNTVRGYGTTVLDLAWRLAHGFPQQLKLLGCSKI